ncbi:MAG TPA: hypothetical protein VFK40_03245 [Nitrososphaeraceae archaeon]|nr:hypothetical protein [Nitrososphaeraceae archaeon]
MHQTFTILILLITILFLFILPNFILNNIEITASIFQQNELSKMKDNRGDTKLINIHKTDVVPDMRDFHDILSIDINKVNDNKVIFTIELAGDANKNEKYETVFIWLVYYYTTNDDINALSSSEDRFRLYTILIPSFGADSNFENKEGWYLAIYNNTNNSYTLPLSKISDMPKNKVQIFIDPILFGNPPNFNFTVSSLIRVNNTFLDKPPDYLVDYVPDSFYSFWKEWFR